MGSHDQQAAAKEEGTSSQEDERRLITACQISSNAASAVASWDLALGAYTLSTQHLFGRHELQLLRELNEADSAVPPFVLHND